MGEPSFLYDGAPWRFAPPPRALPLLAHLVVRPGAAVSRARLAALLWPDDSEEDGRGKLRRHLHQLQRALPPGHPWLDVQSGTVAWNAAAPCRVDVVDFERFASDEATYARAVELYRGDFMHLLVDDWIIAERERLRALQLDMLFALGTRAYAQHRLKAAVQYASQILSLDEWREDAIRLDMSAKYESGDRSGALAAYDRFAEHLAGELGVDPMPQTQALRNAIEANEILSVSTEERDRIGEDEAPLAEHRLPFVGREEELERLKSAWNRAARGFGTTVFVSGEAGIGKSRLAFELASVVRAQGGRVLTGGVSNPEGEPYQPVLAALRKGIACCAGTNLPETWLSALADVLPEIRGVRENIPASEALEPARAVQRLFEALGRLLEAIGKQKPLLLVLEDLHWAGEPTLDLLAFLTRRLGSLPLLIVATYRTGSGAESAELLAIRRKLIQEHRALSIVPGRLSETDLGKLVAQAGLFFGAPGELVPRIATLSAGNALFATQLLYGYVESRTLPDREAALETVGTAISTRFARLEGHTKSIAQAAAAAGESFASDFIAAIGGWPEHEVLEAFDVLIDKGMIREAGAATLEYAFSHALIAQSLYDAMPQRERMMRHRRIASLLEKRGEHERAGHSAIARHWMLAGEHARAKRAYLSAAQAALAIYARADAERHARAALDLAADDEERFTALLLIAKAQDRNADSQRSRSDLDDLIATARRIGRKGELFQALAMLEPYQMITGDRDGQRATITEMLAISTDETMRAERVKALDALGNLERLIGRLEQSVQLHREALSLAGSGTDRAAVSAIHRRLVQSLGRLGDIEGVQQQVQAHRLLLANGATPADRLDLLSSEISLLLTLEDEEGVREKGREMLAVAQTVGDLALEGQAHLIMAYYFREGEEAREHYECARRLAEQIGERLLQLTALLNLGTTEVEFGRCESAIELATTALSIAREVNAPSQTCFALVALSEANRLLGELDAAAAFAREAIGAMGDSGDKRSVASARLAHGLVLIERGDRVAGIAEIERAVDLRRQAQSEHALAEALSHLCIAYIEAGNLEAAERCGAELYTCIAGNALRSNSPLFCWALSRVAAARGDRAEAFKWGARGKTVVMERLAKADAAGSAAYRRLTHVAELIAAV